MPSRLVLVAVLVGLALTSCGGDEDSGRDPGCAIYSDFLAEVEDPTDAQAIAAAEEVEAATEDEEVRSFAVALRARLEDGEPITAAFQGLGRACGLL